MVTSTKHLLCHFQDSQGFRCQDSYMGGVFLFLKKLISCDDLDQTRKVKNSYGLQ